jgi:VWFA-related protein
MLPMAGAQETKPDSTATQQVPSAGGPEGDTGPYAVPKKPAQPAPPPEKPKPVRNPAELGDITIRRDVPVVNVDVMVTTQNGQFIPGLHQNNFRVLEDGTPQQISTFGISQAPVTAVLLVEFASTWWPFIADGVRASYAFANTLKPDDWVAVISYDMKPRILTDFTRDKREVLAALNQLRIPGMSETNLFDALYDAVDRLEGLEGRKYIVLIASGNDTFSKITYGRMLQKLKASHNTTIFTISTGGAFRERMDADPRLRAEMQRMTYLQADNEMTTFAKYTGGRSYFPRFQGEFPEIFRDIGNSIRNQYQISYHPTNTKQDGSYRKLKVELVDPANGKPLRILDQKGKELKYSIYSREGYTAKHAVE